VSTTARTPLSRAERTPPAGRTRQQRTTAWRLPADPWLIIGAAGVGVCSLMMLDAIPGSGSGGFVTRQAIFLVLGTLAGILASRLDYTLLRQAHMRIWVLLIGMLAAVFVVGKTTRGSTLSIPTPFFDIQVSELGKVLLAVVLAGVVCERARETGSWRTTARILAIGMVPTLIVLVQDLGSGLVYLAIIAGILYVGGAPGRHLAVLGACAAIAVAGVAVIAPAAGVPVLKTYQIDRLTSFLHPSGNPASYQQNQSQTAIGSGGKTGRGNAATQTKLQFLPEPRTDFAFASFGERWGFTGAALLLLFYALIIWRALRIVSQSRDLFGALIAAGIVAMLLFQVFENAGMNLGIMPITGIPLPLFSYGGSSVISTLLALGLLQSIHARGQASARIKGRITSGL